MDAGSKSIIIFGVLLNLALFYALYVHKHVKKSFIPDMRLNGGKRKRRSLRKKKRIN